MSTTTSHNTTPASSENQVLSGPPSSPRPATTGRLSREDAVLGTPGTSSFDAEEAVPRPGPRRARRAADVLAGGLPSLSIVAHLVGRGSEDGQAAEAGTSRGGELPAADSYDSDARPAGLGLLRTGSWAHEGFERR